jgi:hypothetical protein
MDVNKPNECSRNKQHNAQICTTIYSYMLAPTCFGSNLPSSGSLWIRLSYVKTQIDMAVYRIMYDKFRLKNLYIMPPSIYHHELSWTKKDAVSAIEKLHMFLYLYMYSVCVDFWKVENEGNSFYINTHSINKAFNVDWFGYTRTSKKIWDYIMFHMTGVKHRCQFFVLLFVLSFNVLYS